MSNKELYKRSFDKLCPSEEFEKEIQTMMDNKKNKGSKLSRRMLSLVAAVVVLTSLAVGASATGLLENVKLWINGQAVDAETVVDADGTMTVEIENGSAFVVSKDGTRIPVEGNIPPADVAQEQQNDGDVQVFLECESGDAETTDTTEGAYSFDVDLMDGLDAFKGE